MKLKNGSGNMKPILFNTQIVRLILEGRKTQTRRPIKLGKYRLADPDMCEPMNGGLFVPNGDDVVFNVPSGGASKAMQDTVVYCQYEKGDTLWVRETWAENPGFNGDFEYRASVPSNFLEDWVGVWKPSIHMPKRAARIFLEVTDVRVERLLDIDEASAEAEGVEPFNNTPLEQRYFNYNNPTNAVHVMSYTESFKNLWNSIYKNWNENPWVFVIEFKKL